MIQTILPVDRKEEERCHDTLDFHGGQWDTNLVGSKPPAFFSKRFGDDSLLHSFPRQSSIAGLYLNMYYYHTHVYL